MKKIMALLLVMLLGISLLAGCGGGNSGSSDPNVGKWVGVSVNAFGMEMDVDEVYEKGVSLELKANGSCILDMDGDKTNAKWILKGSALTVTTGGIDSNGKIEDGVLTLDFMDMGMEIVFEKEGASKSAGSSKPAVAKEVGHYVLDSLIVDDEVYDAEDLEDSGAEDYYIKMNADGTFELSTDEVLKGTWKNGEIRYKEDGENVVNDYILDGDYLSIEAGDDFTLVFKRVGGTAAAPKSTSGGSSGSSGGSTGGLSGKYFEVDGILTNPDNYFEFFEDGKCVLYLASLNFKMNGKYTVSGNTITFKDADFDDTVKATIDGNKIEWNDNVYEK